MTLTKKHTTGRSSLGGSTKTNHSRWAEDKESCKILAQIQWIFTSDPSCNYWLSEAQLTMCGCMRNTYHNWQLVSPLLLFEGSKTKQSTFQTRGHHRTLNLHTSNHPHYQLCQGSPCILAPSNVILLHDYRPADNGWSRKFLTRSTLKPDKRTKWLSWSQKGIKSGAKISSQYW